MSDYEPPAEMVEALEREICGVYAMTASGSRWTALTRFVLRRQHEREELLLEPLRDIVRYQCVKGDDCGCCREDAERARNAIAAHAKLDAPKVPTLADAVEQIERECPGRVIATLKDSQAWTIIKLAAVEREEKREKR